MMRKLCIYYHSNNWKKPCNNMIAKNLHTAKEKFPEGFFGSSILYINKWNVNKWFFSNEIELFMAYEIDCATMLELYRNSGSWTITQEVLMSLYLIINLKHPLIIYGFSFSALNLKLKILFFSHHVEKLELSKYFAPKYWLLLIKKKNWKYQKYYFGIAVDNY